MEFIGGLLLFVLLGCEYSQGQYFPLPELSSVHHDPQGPKMGPRPGHIMIQAEHSGKLPTFQQFPLPISPRMGHQSVPLPQSSLGIQQGMVPASALHQSDQLSPSLGIQHVMMPGSTIDQPGQFSPSLGIQHVMMPGSTIDQPGQISVNHKQMSPLPTPNLNPLVHQQSTGISLSMESPLVTPQFAAEVIRERAFMNHMRQHDVIPFSRGGISFGSSIQQRPVLLSPVQPSFAISNPFQRGSMLPNVVRQGPLLQVRPFLTRSPSPLLDRNQHQDSSNYLVNDLHQVNRQLPIFSGNIMHPFPRHLMQSFLSGMQVLPRSRQLFAAATGFGGNIHGDINSIEQAPSQSQSKSEANEERQENEAEQLEEYFEQIEDMGLFPAWNALGFWNYVPDYEFENGKIIFEPSELDQDSSKGLVKDKSPEKAVGDVSVEKGFNSKKSPDGVQLFDFGVTVSPSSDKKVPDKESDIVENAKESSKGRV